ncbi:DUF3862 domain-containing protein [Clostridium sporogenes]|nr:DUF3862 domain-containing protein [Clostridium sporogenes]
MKKKTDTASTKNSTKTEDKKEDTRKITYEKFSKVSMGSTYEEVKSILGKGKESTSSEVGGIKTVIYTWNNGDGSNMNVTFQNDKSLGKAQAGLSREKADVNMEKYNKIETGMDYNKVKEILGEGELMSISQIAGSNTSIYSWVNSNGTNMNVTFQDGTSTAKAQFGLK